MRFKSLLNESKDDKLLKDLRTWYDKYQKFIDEYYSKRLKSYYIKVDNPYENFFNGLDSYYSLIEFAEYVVKYCSLYNGKLTRPYTAPHTTSNVSGIAIGLEVNLGSDIVYYTGTNDLDDLRVDFEFLKYLHMYIVKNCMNSNFKYAYDKGDNNRYTPSEWFRIDVPIEEQASVEFDYKKHRPIADDNWLRVRNEMGFLVDSKGYNFI